MHVQAGGLDLLGELGDRALGRVLVARAAPVEGDDRALVLAPDAERAHLRRVELAAERLHAVGPFGDGGVELGPGRAGAQPLDAVRADVGEHPEPDDPARVGGLAAGHARDQAVGRGQRHERSLAAGRHRRVAGVAHDRREHAVDVEEQRRPLRVLAQRREQALEGRRRGHGPSMPAA